MSENPAVAQLIARLEQASEGSRELDARAQAIFYGEDFDKLDDGPRGETHPNDEFSVCWIAKNGKRYTCWWNRAFTRIVDAALAMVPENGTFHVMNDVGLPGRVRVGPCGASIYLHEDVPKFIQADGATPALALCIAALKARQSQDG